jgi:hypothetical protein
LVFLLLKGRVNVHVEIGVKPVLSLPSSTPFIMAESPAFFEAYRHVLQGMQEMQSGNCVPMAR